ncbi:hypothetical protein [Kribbella amoyensis]|nr:hypothetical protein [Kribbella amoyensis]
MSTQLSGRALDDFLGAPRRVVPTVVPMGPAGATGLTTVQRE